jgi:hypothetical protein
VSWGKREGRERELLGSSKIRSRYTIVFKG